MNERLGLASLQQVARRLRPRVDPSSLEVGIVHLGLGAFHRAHQAVFTEDAIAASQAREWGICGVTQRSAAVVNMLRPQDGLYSVLERDGRRTSLRVVGTVREMLFAKADPDALMSRLASPSTRVVTLTVTEKGYRSDLATGKLSPDDLETIADLAGRPARTVVGQLVAGFRARRELGHGPLSVVCCDNLPHNGEMLRGLVADFCALLPRPRSDDVTEWVEANVSFPSTMVDRIVPAAIDADVAEASRLLGLDDQGVVVAEPFRQWVIEDHFAAARPAWELAGAVLTDDVTPYDAIKLRLLNGSHSALAYLGALAGCEHIADAMDVDAFPEMVRRLMDEATPTLSVPPGFDLEQYKNDVLRRFANPALRHRTTQVAMDGSQKVPQRLLGTIRDLLASGVEPRLASLAVAGWMRFVSTRASDAGQSLPVEDPLAERFRGLTSAAGTPEQVAAALLSIREIFGEDLSGDRVFRALVSDALHRLSYDGAVLCVRGVLDGR